MSRRPRVLAGLDLGSAKICVVIAEVDEQRVRVLGLGTAASRGLRKGVIVHVDSTVAAISKAVREAEAMAGCQVRRVIASIGGAHLRGLTSHGVVGVRNGEVSAGDMDRVLDAARAVALPVDREVLHVLPQQYIIDHQGGIREPVGIAGVRLETKVHIVTSHAAALQTLTKCCAAAGLAVDDVVLGSLAAADAVLTPEEKELGVALVDVGGGTTDVLVYRAGAVAHTATLAVGGGHLTNDIATGLRTPSADAEKIKHWHGSARAAAVERHTEIEVPSVGDRPARMISRHVLCEIIQSRVEEIFTLVERELARAGHKDGLASGVVLTGGTALLDTITDVAEPILGVPVRIGSPQQVTALADLAASPPYATAIGLVLLGASEGRPVRVRPAPTSSLGRVRYVMTEWLRDFF